ncbi:MAG TPA: alpha/beta fold hydrolase [Streptosporangiaceae bacterium]|jgi:thioesterase domain-containing protein
MEAAGALDVAEDLKTLRVRRAAARAAGGVLDLVMPMRIGGDDPPLFCAHPLVGLSWCYTALLPHLQGGYPLYGLQARGLRRPEPVPASMQEMARDYADQIRLTQPTGPYHLLGMSLGGTIAFAVAEELQRRGEPIGLLIILDASLDNLDEIEVDPWMVCNLILAQFGYVPAVTQADPDPLARLLQAVRRHPGLGLDEWPDQRLRALQRVIVNNLAVARAYQPGRVRCPMLFFSATHQEPTLAEKLESWAAYVDGPIEPIELDCGHRQMLLPEPMGKLAPAISAAMALAAETVKSPA